MTTQAYLEVFQNTVDVIEHSGGSIGNHPCIEGAIAEKKNIADPNAEQTAELKKEAQEEYLAAAFLLNSDQARYASLLQNLENDPLQGQDNHPKTITAAYNVLTNWKQDPRNITRLGDANDGVSFTNVDMELAGIEESDEGGVTLATDGTAQKPTVQRINLTSHATGAARRATSRMSVTANVLNDRPGRGLANDRQPSRCSWLGSRAGNLMMWLDLTSTRN
jgi:hypothetical protein